VLQSLGEKEFQRENSPLRRHILIHRDTGNHRHVISSVVGDVFQYHRLQLHLITSQEKLALAQRNGTHRLEERFLALLQHFYEI